MGQSEVEKIADAVLYEGYILYPYRASAVKNQRRWNFGVLTPKEYSEAQGGAEAWTMQTECLVTDDEDVRLSVRIRFLHLLERQICELLEPVSELPEKLPPSVPVFELRIDDQTFQTWEEATEREVEIAGLRPAELVQSERCQEFSFSATEQLEPLRDAENRIRGLAIRRHEEVSGAVMISAARVAGLYKVRVSIFNYSPLPNADQKGRDEALRRSLTSAHTILSVSGGEFVSLMDPPEELKEVAAACKNVGTWPVMTGDPEKRAVMLSSPIILYDYPQIAPESAGELCDGTEIDEILSLRIMTLTDDEKREMRSGDEKARQILERTEAMPVEQLWKMHGVLRSLK